MDDEPASSPIVCRTCRKETPAEKPGSGVLHLPVEAVDQHGKSVAEKIYEVSDVMVRLDHSLPQVICMPCMELLEIAYNFRHQIIESNEILTNNKLGFVPIKQEPMDPCEIKIESELISENGDEPMCSKRPATPPDLPLKIAKRPAPVKTTKVKPRNRKYFARMAEENVEEINGRFHCRIDEFAPCNYAPRTFDACNLIRHFRKQHREVAKIKGFFKEADGLDPQSPTKQLVKRQVPVKQKAALSAQKVVEGCLKLVTEHNFPVHGFEWTGFRVFLEGLNLNVNGAQLRDYLNRAADLMLERIVKEMSGRMVSIKIDSACLRERHILTLTAVYEFHHQAMTRVLGIVEVLPNETAEQIKDQLLDVIRRYKLTSEQIYAIAWDEGPTIITSNRKLYKLANSSIQTDPVWNYGDEDDDAVLLARKEEMLESLASELKNDKYTVVRGAIHIMEEALVGIVEQEDPNVVAIEEFTVSLRKDRAFIESQQARLPPLWSPDLWTCKYKTIHSIVKQEWFFSTLKKDFPELDLSASVWQFMRDHEAAFLPLRKMLKQMQHGHQPFSEFYMQWLIVIKDLRRLSQNRFSKPVTDSLTAHLASFKQDMVFNAALYLDPRYNYFKSAVFTPELKEEIQSYIITLHKRIHTLATGKPSAPNDDDEANARKTSTTEEDDDMDTFLTEMFGASPKPKKSSTPQIDPNSPLMQQLKTLEIEPRQPHNYDVWKHWVDRKDSQPELAQVALVVLSAPTNDISLPTTFGAFFAPDQTRYSSKTIKDIISLKLNPETFNKIVPLMMENKRK